MSHDLGLDDVADDRDGQVEEEQTDAQLPVPQKEADDSPWDHDPAGSQNRKDIENRDTDGDEYGVGNSEYG